MRAPGGASGATAAKVTPALAAAARNRAVLAALLCASLAAGEAAVLRAVGFVSAMGLSPQISAPPPFSVFHDARWLLVYHSSWLAFAGEVAGMVALRSAINTAIAVLVWPAGSPRPAIRSVYLANLGFTAAAAVLLSPWVCVSIAASGTSLSWFFLGELLPLVVLTYLLSRGGLARRWWRGLPPVAAAAWALIAFLALSASALAVNAAPGWWAVPVAAAAGAVNAGLWAGLARAVVKARQPRVPALAATLALAVTAGGLLVMSVFSGFGGFGSSGLGRAQPLRAPKTGGRQSAVIYVGGYDSSYDGRKPIVVSPGLVYEQYSYRGLNGQNLPLAYNALNTHQSLARSALLLDRQVLTLHQRTGLPVGIVAESEGTLVARTYLGRYSHRYVDDLILLSPLLRPSRVYYPPAGSDGWGVVTGWELRGMFALVRLAGGPPAYPDEPFVRSLLDHAPEYRNQMMCPVPGVRSIALVPFASAAVAPPGPLSRIPVLQVPGLHGSISGPAIRRRIVTFTRGGQMQTGVVPGYTATRYAAAAWDSPALALADNPAWNYPTGAPDASFGGPICAAPRR